MPNLSKNESCYRRENIIVLYWKCFFRNKQTHTYSGRERERDGERLRNKDREVTKYRNGDRQTEEKKRKCSSSNHINLFDYPPNESCQINRSCLKSIRLTLDSPSLIKRSTGASRMAAAREAPFLAGFPCSSSSAAVSLVSFSRCLAPLFYCYPFRYLLFFSPALSVFWFRLLYVLPSSSSLSNFFSSSSLSTVFPIVIPFFSWHLYLSSSIC